MATFDPNNPVFLENPYPFYEMGLALPVPIAIGPPGFWSAFRYEHVSAVLRDHETWSSETVPFDPDAPRAARSMLSSDPPEHSRLRGLVSQAFTPRMVEQLEPRIAGITAGLLDALPPSGEADLVGALAHPLPVIVIAEILGVPPEDRLRFRIWSNKVIETLGSGIATGEAVPADAQVIDEMAEYFSALVEARRLEPREDLLTGLVRAEVEGSRLSFPELLAMLVLLLVAGNETTTNLISNAVQTFIEHPDQLERVLAQPALWPSAVEEVLRFNAPVQATARRALRDATVAGANIPAGDTVVTWLAAANRDPEAFPEPGRFDVARSPNRHLGFGQGIHYCLGAPLARVEARLALAALYERFRGFRRTTPGPLPRVPTFIMRGVRELPVAYESR